MGQRAAVVLLRISQCEIEARPEIAHGDSDIRCIRHDIALDSLRGIVATTVKRGIRQCFLKRYQDVDPLSVVGTMLTDELHDLLARFGHRSQIARKFKTSARTPSWRNHIFRRTGRVGNGANVVSSNCICRFRHWLLDFFVRTAGTLHPCIMCAPVTSRHRSM